MHSSAWICGRNVFTTIIAAATSGSGCLQYTSGSRSTYGNNKAEASRLENWNFKNCLLGGRPRRSFSSSIIAVSTAIKLALRSVAGTCAWIQSSVSRSFVLSQFLSSLRAFPPSALKRRSQAETWRPISLTSASSISRRFGSGVRHTRITHLDAGRPGNAALNPLGHMLSSLPTQYRSLGVAKIRKSLFISSQSRFL